MRAFSWLVFVTAIELFIHFALSHFRNVSFSMPLSILFPLRRSLADTRLKRKSSMIFETLSFSITTTYENRYCCCFLCLFLPRSGPASKVNGSVVGQQFAADEDNILTFVHGLFTSAFCLENRASLALSAKRRRLTKAGDAPAENRLFKRRSRGETRKDGDATEGHPAPCVFGSPTSPENRA